MSVATGPMMAAAHRSAPRRTAPLDGTADPRFAWQPADVITLLWAGIGGTIGLVVSYLGVSATDRLNTQLAWTALAVGTVVVAGVGNAIWLAAGTRAIKQRRLLVMVRLAAFGQSAEEAAPAVGPGWAVAGRGMTRYHRPDCILVHGKQVTPAEPTGHERAGLRACDVCQP